MKRLVEGDDRKQVALLPECVDDEMSLQVLAYNLKRVINRLGVAGTMKAMKMAGK